MAALWMHCFVNSATWVEVNSLAPLWLNECIRKGAHSPILDPVAEFYHSEWSDCFCKLHSFIPLIYVCYKIALLGPRSTKLSLLSQSNRLQFGGLEPSPGGHGSGSSSPQSLLWCKKQLRPQLELLLPSPQELFSPQLSLVGAFSKTPQSICCSWKSYNNLLPKIHARSSSQFFWPQPHTRAVTKAWPFHWSSFPFAF